MDEVAVSDTTLGAEKPTLKRLFFGDDGLRAGWSFALFLILLIASGLLISLVIQHFHHVPKRDPHAPPTPMTAWKVVIADASQFFLVALIAFVMSLIERRPFARYGLSTKRMFSDFGMGLFWGLFCLSVLIGTLYLTHTIAFDGVMMHGQAGLISGLQWLLAFLCVGLAEEFVTRGYIQYTVARGVAGITRALDPNNRFGHAWGFWVAAFLFSICLFMVAHLGNPGETWVGILGVGGAGALFAFSLYRTGTLWWAIGFHAAWDWAQSFLYGTRDSGMAVEGHLLGSHAVGSALLSGGSVGPEGSVFLIPTLLLGAAIIHFTLPRRNYPLTMDQQPPVQPDLLAENASFEAHAI